MFSICRKWRFHISGGIPDTPGNVFLSSSVFCASMAKRSVVWNFFKVLEDDVSKPHCLLWHNHIWKCIIWELGYQQRPGEEISQLIGEMMAPVNQAFLMVLEDLGFQRLMKHLAPSYQLPSRFYFSDTVIPNRFEREKSHIHFTFDYPLSSWKVQKLFGLCLESFTGLSLVSCDWKCLKR